MLEIAELRRLQTERSIRREVFKPDGTSVRALTSYSEGVKFLNNDRGKLLARQLDGSETLAVLTAPLPKLTAPAAELGSICKTPLNTTCR